MNRRRTMMAIGYAIAGGPMFGKVAWGAPPEALEVVHAVGEVRTRHADRAPGARARAGTRVPDGAGLETGPDGRAVLRLADRGYAVLEPGSRIEAPMAGVAAALFRHVAGAIYYAFHRAEPAAPPLVVRTTVAAIGIRGTRFLVAEAPGRSAIGMRKGNVHIEPTEGEFELHRSAEAENFALWKREFAAGVAREEDAFRRYAAQTRRAFGEYVRSFTLDTGRQAVIEGQRVEETPLDADIERDMSASESFAVQWLDAVRD